MIDFKIARHLEDIKRTALFSGLNDEKLSEILQNSQIIHRKKNQVLFLEGEKIEKFYIILGGIMQFSKIDSGGNEVIISFNDRGNLCDIFAENFTFTCIAIENTTLIAISFEVFKKLIKKDNSLMYNLLLETSLQNHELINQLNSLKINDGKEKIGHFLLTNALKDGRKSKNINLECSKSQIASYLGMRLETFSRILHQLKKEGEISIKKNTISLTKESSLCAYCNSHTSSKCEINNSEFCGRSS